MSLFDILKQINERALSDIDFNLTSEMKERIQVVLEGKLIQTRETAEDGDELKFWDSVEEAYEYSKRNKRVWKISFNSETGDRVRLVRYEMDGQSIWSYEPLTDIIKEAKRNAKQTIRG